MSALDEMVSAWMPPRDLQRPIQWPFLPHEGQEAYLCADHPVVLSIASNRWGKSSCGYMEDIYRALGVHPYKHVPLINRIWCGIPDFEFFERTTRPIFFGLLPDYLFLDWSEKHMRVDIRRVDGGVCYLYFMSYKQGQSSWMGDAIGYYHGDELTPLPLYKEAAARLATTGGKMGLTVTPVNGLEWMEEDLYLPASNKGGDRPDVLVLEGGLAEYDEEMHRSDPKTLGIGRLKLPPSHPMGTHEKVLQFARQYKDPAELLIRVFGIYKKRTGGVYRDFDPEVHVIPAFEVPAYFEVWAGCDPGFHGFAFCVKAQDPKGFNYTPYEYFSSHETASVRVESIWRELTGIGADEPERCRKVGPDQWAGPALSVLKDDPDMHLTVYVDTAEQQEILELNQAAGECSARLVFVALDQRLKARDAGVRRVQNQLAPSTRRTTPSHVYREEPSPVGEPRWYLFDTLYSEWVYRQPGRDASDEGEFMSGSRLAWELKTYRWLNPGPRDPHSTGPDDKSAGGAHMLAAARYAFMARVHPPDAPKVPENETPQQRRVREHRERLAERG